MSRANLEILTSAEASAKADVIHTFLLYHLLSFFANPVVEFG